MIVIYSKDNCMFCEKAKQLCQMMGYEYTENKIGRDVQMDEFMELFPEARSVPQIIADGTHVGGYDQLKEWSEARETVSGMTL